jgi:predicted nucleotidyltransferase
MNKCLKHKIKIAKFAAKILQFIPYIRMISLCNSVACGNPKKDSDIDFFIVAKDKHIFTVRYAAVFLLTIFRLKPIPKKNQTKDKICLSLFLNSFNLNLDRLNQNKQQEYQRALWIADTIPIFDEAHTYLDFVDKNSWVKKYYKNYYIHMLKKNKNIKNIFIIFIVRKFIEFVFLCGIGFVLEKILRMIQIKRLFNFKHSHHGHEKMIINDQIIKLHFQRPCDKKPLF